MNVYKRFIEEINAFTIKADRSAVAVMGELTRAVKRAQMVVDGELAPVADRDFAGTRQSREADPMPDPTSVATDAHAISMKSLKARVCIGVRRDGKYVELRNDLVPSPPNWPEKELSVSVAAEAVQAALDDREIPQWTLSEGYELDGVEIRITFEDGVPGVGTPSVADPMTIEDRYLYRNVEAAINVAERLHAAVEHLRAHEIEGVAAADDQVVLDALFSYDALRRANA